MEDNAVNGDGSFKYDDIIIEEFLSDVDENISYIEIKETPKLKKVCIPRYCLGVIIQ